MDTKLDKNVSPTDGGFKCKQYVVPEVSTSCKWHWYVNASKSLKLCSCADGCVRLHLFGQCGRCSKRKGQAVRVGEVSGYDKELFVGEVRRSLEKEKSPSAVACVTLVVTPHPSRSGEANVLGVGVGGGFPAYG